MKPKKINFNQRKKTFSEVVLGFTPWEAFQEAKRCLQCKIAPCRQACPVQIDIPAFIHYLKNEKISEAIKVIRKSNNLPGVCGRVCPQEQLCQNACVLNKKKNPVSIGYLERFCSDWQRENYKDKIKRKKIIFPNKKVAVIGSGPAGLTCAAELIKDGFPVVIFEALHKPGGVLTYGIPQFRLPKEIVNWEINYLEKIGVKIELNTAVGRTVTFEQLKENGFKAFFIAIGAGLPRFLGIEGENCNGVYSANEFLTRINLMKAYLFPDYHTPIFVGEKVGVIGGGNVALDCARSALRLKNTKEVHLIYRRSREEMPARIEEIENAQEEGVNFHFLASPVRIIPDSEGWVKQLEYIKNKLGPVDASGRRKPLPIKGSEKKLRLDTIVIAIGTEANPLFINTLSGLKVNSRGYLIVDDSMHTSLAGVFAGGDIVSGSATVIQAISQAKKAAKAIKNYLQEV